MNKCETCKHWTQSYDVVEYLPCADDPDRGVCVRVGSNNNYPLKEKIELHMSDSFESAVMITMYDFGCTLHESR